VTKHGSIMCYDRNCHGTRAEPGSFIMSSVSHSAIPSIAINWCKFVPLKGNVPVRHEAPNGEDFCKAHQRYMNMRAETLKKKKEQEEERQQFEAFKAKKAEASHVRARTRLTDTLVELTDEADDDLKDATESEGAARAPRVSLTATLDRMTQMMAQMQIQQAETTARLLALLAVPAPVSVPALVSVPTVPPAASQSVPADTTLPGPPPQTSTLGKGKGKGKGKSVFVLNTPPTAHSDDFADQL